jgi:hypothetical protein
MKKRPKGIQIKNGSLRLLPFMLFCFHVFLLKIVFDGMNPIYRTGFGYLN